MAPWVDGVSIIDDLIVDDGVPSRGHRLALFDERYCLAGVAAGVHKTYGNMIAIELAGGFEEDEAAVVARVTAGPPRLIKIANARVGEKRTQWQGQLGKCKGCKCEIEGGQVVEAAGGVWHSDCFCCGQCKTSLVGVARKKEEAGKLFCHGCWVESFAPTCCVCKGKIEGERVKKGQSYRHPTCRSPPQKAPAAVPSKQLGALKAPGIRGAHNKPRTPPRSPPKAGLGTGIMGDADLLGAELVSSKRAERMVSKYGFAGGNGTAKGPAKGAGTGVTKGPTVRGTAAAGGTNKGPVRGSCRRKAARKPGFATAAQSLSTMAMGYGDLDLCAM